MEGLDFKGGIVAVTIRKKLLPAMLKLPSNFLAFRHAATFFRPSPFAQ